jgi:hypothetical protein
MKNSRPFTFEEWLGDQRGKDSPIGDLAADVARDKDWPTGQGIETYRAHVARGCSGAMDALNEAWQAYNIDRKLARQ